MGVGIPLTTWALAGCTPTAAPNGGGGGTPGDFTGTTLQVWSGATVAAPAEAAAVGWEKATGGKVVVTPVPFAERSIKFAGLISGQDPSIDLVYAGGAFVGKFGTKLYDDLGAADLGVDTDIYVPGTLPVLSSNGALCGLPVHSEMLVYIYNKQMFEAAGLDPDSPPDNWSDLYAASGKLQDGSRFGCAIPWATSLGTGAYYLLFLNSIEGARLLSDDRTQVLFDGDEGLEAFEKIEEGMKAGFFTPGLSQDVEDYATGKMFNDGQAASIVNFAELWGYATGSNPTDFPTSLAPENVGVATIPGVSSGDTGSVNGFEGFGINKFSANKAASLSFLQYLTGPEFQLEMNLGKTLPSSNTSVLESPEVEEVYPIGPVIAEQGQGNLDRYASPFDWEPPISDALRGLYNGEISASQAHKSAVDGVKKIVEDYLAN
jgi:ABC-type glycerol-3-phosphate transport system substrate-binding protein